MLPAPSLFAVTLDCPEPVELARFYQAFVGGKLFFSSNKDYVALVIDAGFSLDFQHVANPAPVRWPASSAARRVHLDFAVDDLDQAEKHLLGIGAVLADFQPGGRKFRVLLDPAGHPFCIATRSAAAISEHAPAQPRGSQ
ncbi:VOC family protein [Actinomadura montaniterrae]|uniref:VOC family protein n=1 Tax=Actinomadura montaniterrae TaxID=1803903 RepID=A0A6L3VU61_9ACTN|nr:VOC family protein [Actinomadura montaniterrae]KAB2381626.1 VOC family protein [Actinomadura montaniterrae]